MKNCFKKISASIALILLSITLSATKATAQPLGNHKDGQEHIDNHHDHTRESKTTSSAEPKLHDVVVEQYQGHVHHQINIQMIQAGRTFLLQADFPSGDMKEKTPEHFLKIRTPHNHFNTSDADQHCKLKTTSFNTKALGNGHSDYFISFEYDCDPAMALTQIDLNPLFSLPVDIEKAVVNVIIDDQVLPQVTLKKQNALVKIKKK